MKIVLAFDSFKGCMTSAEANAAARCGVREVMPHAEVVEITVSDGGEGWLDALRQEGDEDIAIIVDDPLRRPTQARYLIREHTAIIEVAQACGLNLLRPSERNPLVASSFGVGQIIADALHKGCSRFIIGLGGSATSDAGRGMTEALSQHLCCNIYELPRLLTADKTFTIATDVDNPLFGPHGAAAVFAPQKGATDEMIEILDQRARLFAGEAALQMGFDRSGEPGAGAAGGLGYAFMQFFNAERRSGIELLLDGIGFDEIIADADLIITGEGYGDRQTLMGKAPAGILHRALRHAIPTSLLAGSVDNRDELIQAGFDEVISINKKGLPVGEAIKHDIAVKNLRESIIDCCKKSPRLKA